MKSSTFTDFSLMHHIQELLHKQLQIPAHRIGFEDLVLAFQICMTQDIRYYTTELYPVIARQLNRTDGDAVAQAIHEVIKAGYEQGDREVWNFYFPNTKGVPSNKVFISNLLVFLNAKKRPSRNRKGQSR